MAIPLSLLQEIGLNRFSNFHISLVLNLFLLLYNMWGMRLDQSLKASLKNLGVIFQFSFYTNNIYK